MTWAGLRSSAFAGREGCRVQEDRQAADRRWRIGEDGDGHVDRSPGGTGSISRRRWGREGGGRCPRGSGSTTGERRSWQKATRLRRGQAGALSRPPIRPSTGMAQRRGVPRPGRNPTNRTGHCTRREDPATGPALGRSLGRSRGRRSRSGLQDGRDEPQRQARPPSHGIPPPPRARTSSRPGARGRLRRGCCAIVSMGGIRARRDLDPGKTRVLENAGADASATCSRLSISDGRPPGKVRIWNGASRWTVQPRIFAFPEFHEIVGRFPRIIPEKARDDDSLTIRIP